MKTALSIVENRSGGRHLTAQLSDRLAVILGMKGDLETALVLEFKAFALGARDAGQNRLEEALRIKRSMKPADEAQIAYTERVLASDAGRKPGGSTQGTSEVGLVTRARERPVQGSTNCPAEVVAMARPAVIAYIDRPCPLGL